MKTQEPWREELEALVKDGIWKFNLIPISTVLKFVEDLLQKERKKAYKECINHVCVLMGLYGHENQISNVDDSEFPTELLIKMVDRLKSKFLNPPTE